MNQVRRRFIERPSVDNIRSVQGLSTSQSGADIYMDHLKSYTTLERPRVADKFLNQRDAMRNHMSLASFKDPHRASKVMFDREHKTLVVPKINLQ